MADSGIVGCAPFRQTSRRTLTAFEWAVGATALGGGMSRSRVGMGATSEPGAVMTAMVQQTANPAWSTTEFAPSPCLSTYWYDAFGAWYGGFDVPTRTKILGDIGRGLLGSGNTPWGAFAAPQRGGPSGSWEGSLQTVSPVYGLVPGNIGEAIRGRTSYTPITGREALKLLSFLGPQNQLPPGMGQLANAAPSMFMDRQFLLGIQAKQNIDVQGLLAGGQDMAGLALKVLDDVALVWAPGQGASLMDFLRGQVDPLRLLGMLTQMTPDLFGQVTNNLPGILQNLPALGPDIFSTANQVLRSLGGGTSLQGFGVVAPAAAQPGTPPNTGVSLIDLTTKQLAATPSPAPPGLTPVTPSRMPYYVAGGAVLLVVVVAIVAAAD